MNDHFEFETKNCLRLRLEKKRRDVLHPHSRRARGRPTAGLAPALGTADAPQVSSDVLCALAGRGVAFTLLRGALPALRPLPRNGLAHHFLYRGESPLEPLRRKAGRSPFKRPPKKKFNKR